MNKIYSILCSLLLAVSFFLYHAPEANAAELECGTIIPAGSRVTLTRDVGLCDGDDPALTIIGRSSLDLGGYAVKCRDLDGDGAVPNGIRLLGERAKVFGGTVTGCLDNLALDGEGNHLVNQVRSFNTGFDLEGSGGDGIDIASPHNIVRNLKVKNVSDDGIDVDDDFNIIKNSLVDGVGDNGVGLNGAMNKLFNNTIRHSADRGIDIDGDNNVIARNEVVNSGKEGIRADDGMGSVIVRNIARGNEVDLKDESPDCGTTIWRGNFFDTSDPEFCID